MRCAHTHTTASLTPPGEPGPFCGMVPTVGHGRTDVSVQVAVQLLRIAFRLKRIGGQHLRFLCKLLCKPLTPPTPITPPPRLSEPCHSGSLPPTLVPPPTGTQPGAAAPPPLLLPCAARRPEVGL